MFPPSTPRSVDLALLGVAVAWGSSYLAAKDVVPADGVFGFLTLRFGIAAMGLAMLLAGRPGRVTRAELVFGATFGAILAVILTLETLGVTKTSAANAGLIISLTIVLTPLLTPGGRPKPAFLVAAGLALAGVVLLTQSGGFTVPGIGDGLILLAAVARSVHVIAIARLSQGRALDPARTTLVQLLTALVVFIVLATCTGRGAIDVAARFTPSAWLLTGYLALVCTVLAFVVQTWAAQRTSPTRVSLLLGTEPLWAAGFGMLLAGDPVTVVGAAGAALVLIGVTWARTIDGRSALPRRRVTSR